MMLADAISSATSEHAVYFLVAAYVESLHHFHRSLGIPERVIALPVAGLDDLEERLRLLRDTLGSTRQPVMSAAEMAAILECALARLRDVANEGSSADESENTRAAA
jgi:hypothetical protein